MNSIHKNILFTIAYLNVMDFVPTTFEVWRHYVDLGGKRRKTSFFEIIESLRQLEKKNLIFGCDGFWCLGDFSDENFSRKRILKQKISLDKIKKVSRWNSLLCNIPFLRAIIFNGTLAMKNSNQESDWDILVVVKKNHIWVGRLFVSLVLSLFGKRRHGNRIKNRFCLNHYLTDDGLILEEDGIFVASEGSFSFWMIGKDISWKFFQINDFKNKAFMPNFDFDRIENDKFKRIGSISAFAIFVEKFLEKTKIAFLLNEFIKKLMIWKIKNNPKTKKPGADIRISDQALIFLPKPKRGLILEKTKELINKIVF